MSKTSVPKDSAEAPTASLPVVLVVDDDVQCCAAYGRRLRADGFAVLVAHSGEEALALLRDKRVDTILLDALLPDVTGVDIARQLKGDPESASIPIVILTGSFDERLRAEAFESGAEEFLNKPVDDGELTRRVRSLVKLKRMGDELNTYNSELRVRVAERDEDARRSEQILARTLDALDKRIVILDRSRTIVAGNEAWHGAAPAPTQGEVAAGGVGAPYRPSLLGISPSDAAEVAAGLDAVIAKERERFTYECSCAARTADGTDRLAVAVSSFAFGPERYFVVSHEDVTRQRTTESELNASRTLYRTVVQAAPDMILTLTAEGHVVFANRGYPGASVTAVVGASVFDFIESEDVPVARAALARALADGDVCEFEARFGAAGLAKRWYANRVCRSTTTADSLGAESPQLMAFCTDVSERRDAESALSRAEAELEASRKKMMQIEKMDSIGRLAGGVAHDFNNTLTIIISFVRMLLDDLAPSDPRRADLGEVLRAADSATKLTRQLLSFSRQRAVEPTVIELNSAIVGIDKMLRRALGESIELVILPAEDPVLVLLDTNQLEQLILNLAVNAKDAMPKGGTLTLSLSTQAIRRTPTEEPSTFAVLTVTDTGTGMTRDAQARVFEPFFTTKGERGTGLGLATCYGAVNQAGGEIKVESELGVGTVFTILLPCQKQDATPARRASAAPLAAFKSGGVVFAVEDQAPILAIVCRVLRSMGFTVVEARTAEEALSLVERESEKPRLLVTDIVLPGLSGVELARQFGARFAELRILFISGYSGEAPGQGIRADGRTSFLPKPFSAGDLQGAVTRLLISGGVMHTAPPT